jgi:hypothetical protein
MAAMSRAIDKKAAWRFRGRRRRLGNWQNWRSLFGARVITKGLFVGSRNRSSRPREQRRGVYRPHTSMRVIVRSASASVTGSANTCSASAGSRHALHTLEPRGTVPPRAMRPQPLQGRTLLQRYARPSSCGRRGRSPRRCARQADNSTIDKAPDRRQRRCRSVLGPTSAATCTLQHGTALAQPATWSMARGPRGMRRRGRTFAHETENYTNVKASARVDACGPVRRRRLNVPIEV